MKTKKQTRQNAFILNLTDEEAEKLNQLARRNDHPTSTQAYIIVRNYLASVILRDDNGNDIINI